jgi:hypothetical protein
MFGLFKKKDAPKEASKRFPPVPEWRPSIVQPLDRIADRIRYYTNGSRDFVMFEHGTCVILEDGLPDQQAEAFAKEVLHRILHAHPDMNPLNMDDGNILIRYNLPAATVVLNDVAMANWSEIDQHHQQALATDEVLITPIGRNVFDDFGKKALLGRCFMFMDAQDPKVVRIERKTT